MCTLASSVAPTTLLLGSLIPRPRPGFRHFQYGKVGEGLPAQQLVKLSLYVVVTDYA